MKSVAMITFDLSAYLLFSCNRRGGMHIRLIYLLSNNNSIILEEATSTSKKEKKESIFSDMYVYMVKRSQCDI
jgi:Ethanolamine utilization protein EutJ (predicted chaperonin)